MRKGVNGLAVAIALAVMSAGAMAATPDSAQKAQPGEQALEPQIWRIDGGDLRLRMNDGFLDLVGIKVALSAAVVDKQDPQFVVFPVLSTGGLRLNAPDGSFEHFVDGALSLRGGIELKLADGSSVDLRDAQLRPNADNPLRLDVIGADGRVWVYVNHLMYKFTQDYRQYTLRTADLRATDALAQRIGEPALADAYIGEIKLDARVMERSRELRNLSKGNVPIFHGTAHPDGGIYQADVLMEAYDMRFSRCRRSDGVTNGCDGSGADDGEVVFTPNATLRNSNTNRTADIPWYEKFTGSTNPYGYPYTNADQHPYLIWNMFRIVDGQLEQIGASGTKHAFLTINVGCAPGAFTGGGHILGLNCSDTYGTGNNDNISDLGPRVEILPSNGQWGRCGSVFDTNCDGNENGNGSCSGASPAGQGCYNQRLVVRESQMLVPGAQFLSEAWYIVQDDINIYNTMGRRTMAPTTNGSLWVPGTQGTMSLGPVINAWVDPVTNPTANIELRSTEFGRARVAVKTKQLDSCPATSGLSGICYRYDYAVHNFDFAGAERSGTLPNLRVSNGRGFDRFRLTLPAFTQVHVDPVSGFADTDINAGNNWTASVGSGVVEWTAPANNNLNWGTLYRFSLVSTSAPSTDRVGVDLRPGNTAEGATMLSGEIIGPAGMPGGIMKNGFE